MLINTLCLNYFVIDLFIKFEQILIDNDDNLHTFTHFLFVRDDRRRFERERGVHTYLCTSNINKMLHQVDHTTGTLNVY